MLFEVHQDNPQERHIQTRNKSQEPKPKSQSSKTQIPRAKTCSTTLPGIWDLVFGI